MGLKSKRGSVGLDSTTQARANQEPSGLLQAVDEEVEAAAAAAGVDLPDLKVGHKPHIARNLSKSCQSGLYCGVIL